MKSNYYSIMEALGIIDVNYVNVNAFYFTILVGIDVMSRSTNPVGLVARGGNDGPSSYSRGWQSRRAANPMLSVLVNPHSPPPLSYPDHNATCLHMCSVGSLGCK